MFIIEFSKELITKMEKIKKKNIVLFETTIKKIAEIKKDPEHYKPLRYNLKDYRRVHVMKSFVLVFKIDYTNNKIIFEDLEHHDKIYKRWNFKIVLLFHIDFISLTFNEKIIEKDYSLKILAIANL